jgi:hypothetical protein
LNKFKSYSGEFHPEELAEGLISEKYYISPLPLWERVRERGQDCGRNN